MFFVEYILAIKRTLVLAETVEQLRSGKLIHTLHYSGFVRNRLSHYPHKTLNLIAIINFIVGRYIHKTLGAETRQRCGVTVNSNTSHLQ